LIWLWVLLIAVAFTSSGSFAYDGQSETSGANDSSGEYEIDNHAAPVLATGEQKHGSIGDHVLFAKFSGFLAAETGVPSALRSGQLAEGPALDAIGSSGKVTFTPTADQINSAAFKVIVGDAKYTASGTPVSTIFDGSTAGGLAEIKSGSSVLNSTYQ
jgi:hypothetical protein